MPQARFGIIEMLASKIDWSYRIRPGDVAVVSYRTSFCHATGPYISPCGRNVEAHDKLARIWWLAARNDKHQQKLDGCEYIYNVTHCCRYQSYRVRYLERCYLECMCTCVLARSR